MFTLVCLPLLAIQNLFRYAIIINGGSEGSVRVAWRNLSKEEVSGPAAPEGPDVRRSGGCSDVLASRGQRASWIRVCVGWNSVVLALGTLPNGCWRSAPLWPRESGLPLSLDSCLLQPQEGVPRRAW